MKSVTSTSTYVQKLASLKLGCAPEFVDILEQGIWGQIYSPLKDIDILLSNIFVVCMQIIIDKNNNHDRSSEF